MAPSFMKKTMVYLGLLDDEYDEYDDLEDRAPRAFTSTPRSEVRQQEQRRPGRGRAGDVRAEEHEQALQSDRQVVQEDLADRGDPGAERPDREAAGGGDCPQRPTRGDRRR